MCGMKRKKTKNNNLVKLVVVGIGGAGGNAVTRMNDSLPRGVDLIVVNTDTQDLNQCLAKKKIYIGKNLTHGLGTGMNPELGRQAAEENQSEIVEILKGADMVFLTAGFGGGTGTGALPVIADIARDLGILTTAIVTKPFGFEGFERTRIAEDGIARLRDKVDALITIPNDRIFSIINKNTSLLKAFEAIDEILKNAVLGVAELITIPGLINVDFADIKAIMQNAGSAIIGIGVASGAERATNAAKSAINSPLLEISIDGARGVLFSISGHRDLKMAEVNEIARLISETVHSPAKIIFGVHHDRKLKKGDIKVTLVATGFNGGTRKETGALPNLFIFEPFEPNAKVETIAAEKEAHIIKEKEVSRLKEKKEEKKEDVWDIPAFLRKKKR